MIDLTQSLTDKQLQKMDEEAFINYLWMLYKNTNLSPERATLLKWDSIPRWGLIHQKKPINYTYCRLCDESPKCINCPLADEEGNLNCFNNKYWLLLEKALVFNEWLAGAFAFSSFVKQSITGDA